MAARTRRQPARLSSAIVLAVALACGLSACVNTTPPTATELAAARQAANEVEGALLPAPAGVPATSRAEALKPRGYIEEEWRQQGRAKTYSATHTWGQDGLWSVSVRNPLEAYETRLLVRRPVDPARFNGIVIVEWLNTSLGLDLDGIWMLMQEQLIREGYAWVGVSAEASGIQQLQQGLPERYASASIRTGDLGFDIYTQAAHLVRNAAQQWGTQTPSPRQVRLIAAGYSKSASYLISYANAFQPLTQAFDGYYLRGATPAAIQVHDFGLNVVMPRWRPDLAVPVMQVQTEGEVKASWVLSDTPDSAHVRYVEIAGAVHFDAHMQQMALDVGQPWGLKPPACRHPVIDLPAHVVDHAAIEALRHWVVDGREPSHAPRLQRSARGWLEYDGRGNVLGGIRLPQVSLGTAEYKVYGNLPASWPNLWSGFSCMAGGARLPTTPQSSGSLQADALAASRDLARRGWLMEADVERAGQVPLDTAR